VCLSGENRCYRAFEPFCCAAYGIYVASPDCCLDHFKQFQAPGENVVFNRRIRGRNDGNIYAGHFLNSANSGSSFHGPLLNLRLFPDKHVSSDVDLIIKQSRLAFGCKARASLKVAAIPPFLPSSIVI